MACNVIRRGGSATEIERGIRECAPIRQQKDLEASEVAQAAVSQLQANNAMLGTVASSLERMLAILGILFVVLKIVPVARVIPKRLFSIASVATEEALRQQLSRVQVMRAANDETIAAIRRAAQNDPFFLRAAGG